MISDCLARSSSKKSRHKESLLGCSRAYCTFLKYPRYISSYNTSSCSSSSKYEAECPRNNFYHVKICRNTYTAKIELIVMNPEVHDTLFSHIYKNLTNYFILRLPEAVFFFFSFGEGWGGLFNFSS